MGQWVKSLFSIDEKRTSTLVVVLLAFSILAIYMCVTTGDLPENLRIVLIVLVCAIGGVNIPAALTTTMAGRQIQNQEFPLQDVVQQEEGESEEVARG